MKEEYIRRIKKIWESELSDYNKHVAHNAFAVPVLVPTFGLLNWKAGLLLKFATRMRSFQSLTSDKVDSAVGEMRRPMAALADDRQAEPVIRVLLPILLCFRSTVLLVFFCK